jgi:predicted porin
MKNQNRLIAAALGALFAAASHAESVVEMYGMAMPFVDSSETKNATTPAPATADRPNQLPATAYTGANDPRRVRMTVGTSHWGFRGYEDLWPGLRAVWQLESGFQIDQNTGPGLGARDSKLGLQNPVWGEVFMGQWDTPYKYISLPVNPLRAGFVFDRTAITGNPGFNVPNTTTQFTRANAKPDASFDRRQGNSVQYWSPKWGGFSFRLDHSVNEGKGALVAGGPILSPVVNSAAVQYDVGQLSIRYGYEQHKDYFGMTQIGGSAAGTATNGGSKDEGQKIVFLWRIGNTRITAMYEQLKYHNNDSLAGAVYEFKRNAYYGVLEQRFGPGGNNSVWISYGRAADGSCNRVGGLACSTHAVGADYMTLGYIYRFSKRTEGFIAYYKLNNKQNGQYSPGPFVNAVSVAPGADTDGAGVGMIHYF